MPTGPNIRHASPRVEETLNAASFACTAFKTSGSGAGSTLVGGARGHSEHKGCLQRTHSRGSTLLSFRFMPSGLSGWGTGGKTLVHLWQEYLTGRDVLDEGASPG